MLPVILDLIVERPPEVRWLLPFLPSLPLATSLFHSVYSILLFTSEDTTHNSPWIYQYIRLSSTDTPPASGWDWAGWAPIASPQQQASEFTTIPLCCRPWVKQLCPEDRFYVPIPASHRPREECLTRDSISTNAKVNLAVTVHAEAAFTCTLFWYTLLKMLS